MSPRVFAPEPMRLRSELVYGVVGVVPAAMWSASMPTRYFLPSILFALTFVVGGDAYKALVRGRDTMVIGDAGIEVSNLRTRWTMAWTDIARVYRFKERVHFEPGPPHTAAGAVARGPRTQ